MPQLLNDRFIIFNPNLKDEITEDKKQKKNKVGITYFAIPAIAYKVVYREHAEPDNIIKNTIIRLNQLGYTIDKISSKLCLSVELIKYVLNETDQLKSNDFIGELKETIGYIIYNCYGESFFRNYLKEEDFEDYSKCELIEGNLHYFKIRSNLASSKIYDISILQKPNYCEVDDFNEKKISNQTLKIFNKYRYKYSNNSYISAEYLHEKKNIYLVCCCCLFQENLLDYYVFDPIYKGEKEILYEIKSMMINLFDKFPDENKVIQENIKRMYNYARDNYDMIDVINSKEKQQAIVNIARKFNLEEIKYYDSVYKGLIDNEILYDSSIKNIEKNADISIITDYCGKFQKSCHELLEHVFVSSFRKYFKNSNNDYFLDIKAKTSFYKLTLRSYISKVGFKVNDSDDSFLSSVSKDSLIGMFKNHLNFRTQKANIVMMGNIIEGMYDDNHPIHELSKRIPDFINILLLTNVMRRSSAHNDEVKLLNSAEIIDLKNIVDQTIDIMFKIQPGNTKIKIEDINFDKNTKEQLVNLKVRDYIDSFNFDKDYYESSVRKMYKSFLLKQKDFYADASNVLDDIFMMILSNIYSEEKLDMAMAKLTHDDKNNLQIINELLHLHGCKYIITQFPSVSGIKSKQDFKDNSLAAKLFLTVLMYSVHDSNYLFNLILKNERLFEVADRIILLRGHNNICEYNDDIGFKSYDELIDQICKFCENIK